MRLRHKQPTLVSMWMLDVFCCALGCVILLLLLKMREANFSAEESLNVQSELSITQSALSDSEAQTVALSSEVTDRNGRIALVEKERDNLARELALVRKGQADTARELALVQSQRDKAATELALVRTERDQAAKNLAAIDEKLKATAAELALTRAKIETGAKMLDLAKERDAASTQEMAKKQAEIAELARKLAVAQKDLDAAQTLVRDKEKARAEAMRRSLDAGDRLTAAEVRLKQSQKQVDDLTAKAGDAAKFRSRVTELEKQIAEASITIVDLQGTKAKLADKVDKLQIEAETRFAGIAMTGRNVVFLVDMSGSMDRTDENTVNETKWPTVRETLLKVMRSLPELERYQVILFSNKHSYLMGNDGQWLRYEKQKSVEQVRKAMAAAKPIGGTNLYGAFDESFRFRAKGLDTIYLFSDGLPTTGPGLTLAQEAMNENDRGVVLAKMLRQAIKVNWNAPDVRGQRVRVNSVGFFYESPDVGAFLWALSRDNDGSFVGMSKP